MIFDTPQWKWRVAAEVVQYGHVTGAVDVYPERGKAKLSAVVVPTEFFQLVDQVLPETKQAEAVRDGIRFYCEDAGGGRWIFGFEFGQEFYDLWPYTRSTLPVWFDKARTP